MSACLSPLYAGKHSESVVPMPGLRSLFSGLRLLDDTNLRFHCLICSASSSMVDIF
jgi:hypothetical protein